MRKFLIILFLLPTIVFAQVKTSVNIGIDPVTGEPGYLNYDTSRTLYFQGPALIVSGDTVSFAGSSGVWALNGTKAYYLGYAGLGTTFPRSRFEVQTNYNTTVGIDSLGITLSQSNVSTSGVFPTSPPYSFEVYGWNSTTSAPQKSRADIYAQGNSGPGAAYPSVYFRVAKDTSNYFTWLSYTGNINFYYALVGTSAAFSNSVSANGGLIGYSNNIFNNPASGNAGQTIVGKNGATIPIEPSAIFGVYGGGIQGMLLPKMTTAQRDSFGYTVSAITITNGGSGYTTAPSITNTQTYLNGLAPAANGVQSWYGNYLSGTVSISGGAVTGATITQGGYFNGAVKINFSGGGGTGATATATMSRLLPTGLLIYNSDLKAVQTWNGSGWSTGSYVSKTVTLASGTVTVSEPSVLSTSRIMVSCNTPSGTQGFLSVPQSTVSAGSFVINSSSGSDNSTVNWIVTN